MEVKLQKNVPLPNGFLRREKSPFRAMKVGDSFLVPDDVASTFRANAYQSAKRLNMIVTVRNTEEGLRCWRIK